MGARVDRSSRALSVALRGLWGISTFVSRVFIRCVGGQGRSWGVPMTMAELLEVTKGNVTFVDGGVYAADYESPGYLSPVCSRLHHGFMRALRSLTVARQSPLACVRQHPAHWHVSYVNLLQFSLHNESGFAPPMTYAFTGGVPLCTVPHGCGPHPWAHFSNASQMMFKLATRPDSLMIPEGVSPCTHTCFSIFA
jgi:hypothetical protein